ncbi:hypothetical protein DRP53_04695 [candidate division WOR-3 bacterium]|uniref:Tetratricopeptide repeat protein n=1 Tax=candidate division WOR-3 bacterium TaxID=2052148 RepID=A0A660SIQ6_UNCW3|nr:MAG: hypothetical protein DRP53_04695 [candidate division WOR-3 bacterium]
MIAILLILGQSILGEARDYSFIQQLFEERSYSLVVTEIANFRSRYPQSKFNDDLNFLEAESFFRLKEYDEALRLFMRYLKFGENQDLKDDAHLRVIQSHFAMKNDEEVIGWANRFPKESPRYPEAIYLMGEAQYRLHRYLDATKSYNRLLSLPLSEDLAPKVFYSLAHANFRLKRYEKAIEVSDRLIDEFPDHDLAREVAFLKARALIQLGRKEEAFEYLEFISEQNEEIAFMAKIIAGDLALEAADYPTARRFYQRALRYYPQSPDRDRAYLGLGRVALKEKRFEAAIKYFRIVIDSFPHSLLKGQAEHELGLAYLGLGKFAFARGYLRKSRDYYHLGLSFFQEGDYPNAIKYLTLAPSSEKVERLLGAAYYRQGEYELGIEHFRKAKASKEVARGYLALKKPQAAIDALAEAKDYDGVLYRAEIRYQIGDYEGALSDYLKALSLKDRPEPAYGAGWALYRLNDYDGAVRYFQIVTGRFPQSPLADDAWLTIGDIYLSQKRYSDALLAYQGVSKTSTCYQTALFRIGLTYLRQNNYTKAIDYFARIKSDEARYMTGYSYFQLGKYQSALGVLARISDTSRYFFPALQMIGDCYFNSGDDESALQSYLRLYRDQDSLPYLISALDGLKWVYERRGDRKGYLSLLDSLAGRESRPIVLAELHLRLARGLIGTDRKLAHRHLNFVIENSTSDQHRGEALLLLTDDLLKKGDFDSALTTARRLNRIPGYREQGLILLLKGLSATKKYRQMISVAEGLKDQSLRYYYLGIAWKNLGRIDLAIRNLRKMLDSQPEGGIAGLAYWELARIKMAQKSYSEAEGLLRNAIKFSPDSIAGRAQFSLGDVMRKVGKLRDAIVEYRRIEYLFPQMEQLISKAYLRIGECYESLGEKEKAIQSYRYLKERYPESQWAAIADERLAKFNP